MIDALRGRDKLNLTRFYFSSAVGSGGAGVGSVVVAVFAGLVWDCKFRNLGCNDGQGGVILVFLAPVMFIVGCGLGCVATWVRLKLPDESILSSVYVYSGPQERLNRNVDRVLRFGFWSLVCLGLFVAWIYVNEM